MVRDALRGAISERASAVAAEVRQAGLSADQVQQFVRSTIQAARTGRVLRDFMAHVGAVSIIDRPESPPLRFRSWMNKRFFTGDASYVGQERTAHDFARRANVSELGSILDVLPQGPVIVVSSSVRDAVENAIRAMRDEGLSPSLVLTPTSYKLAEALGVNAFGGVILNADIIPVVHSRAFSGLIENVPVFDDPRVSSDRLLIVDLARSIRFEEWPSDSDSGIEVSVKAFDADEAAVFVDEHRSVVSEESTPAETVELLQERVLIEMGLCWRVLMRDPSAIRLIEVPEWLRRDSE